MKQLWAPWRYPWIKESKDGVSDCFLCDAINAPESQDREHLVLHRGTSCFIIMNRYPYSNGHLMISPNRHIHDYTEMNEDEILETGQLTQVCLKVLKVRFTPHGFNMGYNLGRISGAGLEDHLHHHVVPRWSGDTNFMPVVGKTKVISQDLWESYDLLKSELTDNKEKYFR